MREACVGSRNLHNPSLPRFCTPPRVVYHRTFVNKRRLRESFHGSRPTGRGIKAPAKASGTLLSGKNVLLFPSIRAEIEETSVRVLQKYTFYLMPITHFLKKQYLFQVPLPLTPTLKKQQGCPVISGTRGSYNPLG